MEIRMGSFDAMANDIQSKKREVVIFGCGVIGTTVALEIFSQYGLLEYISCFVDNNQNQWGETVTKDDVCKEVRPPQYLASAQVNAVIVLAISRYAEVLEQLELLACTEKMVCYILPMLCIQNFGKSIEECNEMFEKKGLIPKMIHYMWLGKKKMPDNLAKCIESWRRHCPDYEIIRWDETNYDIHKNAFVEEAYKNGKYGFVPDFARLDILYSYGGIYMDTDVEVIKSLDSLLANEAFTSVEKWQVVNFGSCCGSIKGHKSLEMFLAEWEKRKLIRADGYLDNVSSGKVDTEVALKNGYKLNGKRQSILGMTVYPYDYFNPYDYMTGDMTITQNTYAIHHFNGGWLDDVSKENVMRTREKYNEIMGRTIWIRGEN